MFEEGIQGIRVLEIKIHDNVYFNCHVSVLSKLSKWKIRLEKRIIC